MTEQELQAIEARLCEPWIDLAYNNTPKKHMQCRKDGRALLTFVRRLQGELANLQKLSESQSQALSMMERGQL